ncbi:hypothetical protein F511_39093 [Dorcoceras hygrometricum]|uniref:Uncharacterized protein n=1 Tax=Dorcoceras hygrometricum TaxID=472368 RepID=A0A2Z7CZR4_9LAMI|nr:hypothetical protein F511_39093 [Dorcoceras hygrometricum]
MAENSSDFGRKVSKNSHPKGHDFPTKIATLVAGEVWREVGVSWARLVTSISGDERRTSNELKLLQSLLSTPDLTIDDVNDYGDHLFKKRKEDDKMRYRMATGLVGMGLGKPETYPAKKRNSGFSISSHGLCCRLDLTLKLYGQCISSHLGTKSACTPAVT